MKTHDTTTRIVNHQNGQAMLTDGTMDHLGIDAMVAKFMRVEIKLSNKGQHNVPRRDRNDDS